MTEKKLDVASAMAKFAAFFKAIPSDKLADITDVMDTWNKPDGEHSNPSREQIVTGPAQRASGDGAPKMIAEYSSPAPQQGLTEQYKEFQSMLDGWGKAFTDKLNANLSPIIARHDTALKSILGVFAEAKKAQEVTAPAAPGADTFLGKALGRITKAKLALRKADMADDDEKEERKSQLASASDLLKSAKRLLAKAMEDMEDTDDEGCEKALSTLQGLTKAVAKAEKEDDEMEKAETAKAAAAAKAVEDAAAATKKAEDEKEAAEKAKAAGTDATSKAVTQEQLQEALKGLTVLPNTVQGLIDAVMGKSVNPVAPEISKGTVVDVDFAARVDAAIDAGQLDENTEMRALSMLQHQAAVKAGRMDAAHFAAEIAKAPAAIRELFQVAA